MGIQQSTFDENDKVLEANGLALLPLLVFVLFYFGLSIAVGDFYKIPMPWAFMVAGAVAIALNPKISINQKVERFAFGMGKRDIMIMCLIFILAGAFAATAKSVGGVDSAVAIARHFIPAQWMTTGLFIVSALISLSIGTSCGTIAAIAPIAVALSQALGTNPGVMLGVTIGGAMFGDNLSLISDTTIAATRTQNVEMRDKMIANVKLVMAPAIACMVIYALPMFSAVDATAVDASLSALDWLKVTPYVLLLVFGCMGINVMMLLFVGIILNLTLGVGLGVLPLFTGFEVVGKGIFGMAETLVVALLAGGLLETIRYNGGIEYILKKTQSWIHDKRTCEAGICVLVGAVNIFTANNTVAIITAGPIARELTVRFGADPKRSASLLDTVSCFVQGLLPYGAQVLIALGLAGASSGVDFFSLLPGLLYPFGMGLAVIFSLVTSKD